MTRTGNQVFAAQHLEYMGQIMECVRREMECVRREAGCNLAKFYGEFEHVHLLVNLPASRPAAFTTSLKADALVATPVA